MEIIAGPTSIGKVLDHLSYVARQQGAIALHGRVEPGCIQSFVDKHCIITPGRYWTLFHSKNPEISQAIHSNKAFLTRLEGEFLTT